MFRVVYRLVENDTVAENDSVAEEDSVAEVVAVGGRGGHAVYQAALARLGEQPDPS